MTTLDRCVPGLHSVRRADRAFAKLRFGGRPDVRRTRHVPLAVEPAGDLRFLELEGRLALDGAASSGSTFTASCGYPDKRKRRKSRSAVTANGNLTSTPAVR